MILKLDPSCEFCKRSFKAEELRPLEVPLFPEPARVCAECADDLERGGRRLLPFEPRYRARTDRAWPGPEASDVIAALAAARAALAKEGRGAPRELPLTAATGRAEARRLAEEARQAGFESEGMLAEGLAAAALAGEELLPAPDLEKKLDRLAKTDEVPLLHGVYAHRAGALDAARFRYLEFLPFKPATELQYRVGALAVALRATRGERGEAEAALRPLLAAAVNAPLVRDPRLPLLQALLHFEAANKEGGDRALAQCLAWLDALPAGSRPEVRALALRNVAARAAETGSHAKAKEALREYVKLAPQDRRAKIDLAHAYIRTSLDPVAREVLAPILDEEARRLIRDVFDLDPSSDDARLLYATCLARLGETEKAWAVLRDRIELGGEQDASLDAELRHVAALCAHALGKEERARELLLEAFTKEQEPSAGRSGGGFLLQAKESGHASRATRANLATLVQEALAERLLDATPETLGELYEWSKPYHAGLLEEYSPTGVDLLRDFVGWEVARGFATHVAGPEPIDTARFRHEYASVLQAYVFLAKRRLGEAVRAERSARAAGAAPVPLLLILRVLGLMKRGAQARGA